MKQFKRIAALALMGVVAFSVAGCGAKKADGTVKEMKGEELNKIEDDNKEKEKVLVIDVRSPEEYKAGHVRHAINMPVDTIEKDVPEIKARKEDKIITVCNTGKKSMKAAEILAKAGVANVYNAEGVKDFKYTDLVTYTNLLAPEFKKAIEEGKGTFIDARDEKDYKEKHVKGAIHMTKDTFDATKVPKDKPVYVYCYSGNRSAVVADMLAKDGYKNVFNALDGTKEYKDYPME